MTCYLNTLFDIFCHTNVTFLKYRQLAVMRDTISIVFTMPKLHTTSKESALMHPQHMDIGRKLCSGVIHLLVIVSVGLGLFPTGRLMRPPESRARKTHRKWPVSPRWSYATTSIPTWIFWYPWPVIRISAPWTEQHSRGPLPTKSCATTFWLWELHLPTARPATVTAVRPTSRIERTFSGPWRARLFGYYREQGYRSTCDDDRTPQSRCWPARQNYHNW